MLAVTVTAVAIFAAIIGVAWFIAKKGTADLDRMREAYERDRSRQRHPSSKKAQP